MFIIYLANLDSYVDFMLFCRKKNIIIMTLISQIQPVFFFFFLFLINMLAVMADTATISVI